MQEFNTDSCTRTNRDRHRQTIGEGIPVVGKCRVEPSVTNAGQERWAKRRDFCATDTSVHNIFRSPQGTVGAFGWVYHYRRNTMNLVYLLWTGIPAGSRDSGTHKIIRKPKMSGGTNEEYSIRSDCTIHNKTQKIGQTSTSIDESGTTQPRHTWNFFSMNEKITWHSREKK